MVTRWQDDRGFGFITPAGGGSPVFAHVSEFPANRRPRTGEAVTFRVSRDDEHRLRASRVQYLHSGARKRPAPRGVPVAGAVAVAFVGALAVLAQLRLVPVWILGLEVALIAATFLLYRADKAAAMKGAHRVSESTLHLVSVFGGWPGALLAQQFYRHKTRKQPFRTTFWLTVALNCAVLAWVAFGEPSPL